MNEKQLLPSESFSPVLWSVVFFDMTRVTSKEDAWEDFADVFQIDGVSLHLSRKPISQITIAQGESIYSLLMEDPSCCFGFHRWRLPVGGERKDSEWLYSAFGFFRETERIILQVTKTSGRMLVQERATPFLL